jgi:uncharacterized protein (DUF1778 family)
MDPCWNRATPDQRNQRHHCRVRHALADSRIAVRLTSEQDALIRRAAEAEGTDLTNFTVTATLVHARDVLADWRLFALDDAAWTQFLAMLDRPVSAKPQLEKLFAEPSMFDDE